MKISARVLLLYRQAGFTAYMNGLIKSQNSFEKRVAMEKMTSYFKTSIKLQNEMPGEYILKG